MKEGAESPKGFTVWQQRNVESPMWQCVVSRAVSLPRLQISDRAEAP